MEVFNRGFIAQDETLDHFGDIHFLKVSDQMSLRLRLMALLAGTMLPLVGLIAYNQMTIRTSLRDDVEERSLRIAANISAEQGRLAEGMRQVLATIKARPPIGAADACAMSATIAAELSEWKTVYVADPSSTVICSSRPSWIGQRVKDGVAAPGTFSLARLDDGSPIFRVEGRLADGNTVGLAIDPHWLDGYLASLHPPPGLSAALIDDRGRIIHRVPDAKIFRGRAVPGRYTRYLRISQPTLVRMPGVDEVDRVHLFAPLSADIPGVLLDVAFEEGAAYGESNRMMAVSAVVIALTLTSSLAIAWLGGRHVVIGPIDRLMQATRQWRAGNYAIRVQEPSSIPELRELAFAFDGLVAELGTALGQARETAGKLNNILESTADSIVELDRQWRYTYLSSKAEAALRVHRPLVGESIWEAFPFLIGSRDEECLRRAMTTGCPEDYETYHADWGRWFSVRAFPHGDRLVIFFRDITARKKLEDEAARGQAMFGMVTEALPVGVWIIDETGRIAHGNPAGVEIWGGARYASVNEFGEYRAWFAEGGEPVTAEKWAGYRAFSKGETTTAERLTIQCFDGKRKTILNSAVPLRAKDGRIIGAVVVNEDVTALNEAKVEAEHANLAKSRFLAAANHDLRQPVQAMVFMIDVLTATVQDVRIQKIVGNLKNAIEALRFVLDELTEVSRLDAGLVEAKVADVPLAPLLEQLHAEYSPRMAAKGLELRIVRSSAWVRSDTDLLGRELRNLLENALRYTNRGKVLIGARRHGTSLLIQVCDTGIGIPATRLGEIWEEFVQVGNPERNYRMGLGLGLSIVRRLAHMMGHTVTVQSVEGRGSVFTVELPCVPSRPPCAEPGPQAIPSARGNVLVIEDQPEVLTGLVAVLEGAGFAVAAGDSLSTALDNRVATGMPYFDIVVSDFRLKGGATGVEAIAEIRRTMVPRVPAVILTGDSSLELIDAMRRGEFDALLSKPVGAKDLIETILSLLPGRNAVEC